MRTMNLNRAGRADRRMGIRQAAQAGKAFMVGVPAPAGPRFRAARGLEVGRFSRNGPGFRARSINNPHKGWAGGGSDGRPTPPPSPGNQVTAMHDPQPFQPSPLRPGQSWPVLPPGVSYAKGLPAVDWPALPGQPDPALADPLDPATTRGLVPAVDPPAAPAPAGLGHYLALGLRQTARGLARAWQSFSPAAPAPAPFPPGVGVGAATPKPAPLGARSE